MNSPTRINPILESLSCQYAFYFLSHGGSPVYASNCERFVAASLIKVPILLAWLYLERNGKVQRSEKCSLDDEAQVQGSGFSWLLAARQIPFQDVLLMMIALSDNLCTNLVIRRIGFKRLNAIFHGPLGLSEVTRLERKLMDYEAREHGLENWISPQDCIRLFELLHALTPGEKAWVKPMFMANQDSSLLLRDVPRDSVAFFHKTGSLPGVLHDWGFTHDNDLFLLTQGVEDEEKANEVFGCVGKVCLKGGEIVHE